MRKRGNESPDTSDSDFDEELRADRLPRVQEIYNFLGKYESMPKRGNESPDTLYSDSEQQLRAERSLRVQEFYDFLGKYESRERKKKAVAVDVNVNWINILDEMLRDPASRFSALHGAMVRAFVGGYLKCDGCERCAAPNIVIYEYSHPRHISNPADLVVKYYCRTCNEEDLQKRQCMRCSTTQMQNHKKIWCRYPLPIGSWVCGGCAPYLNKNPCCSVCHCHSYNYHLEESDEDDDDDNDDESSDSYRHSENSDNNDGFNDVGYLPDGTAMCQICARKRRFTMCPAVDGYCNNFIPRDDDYDDTDLCAACHLEWESSFT